MGSIIRLKRKDGQVQFKAVFDLPPYVGGKRRRTSKTFPVGTPYREAKAYLLEREMEKRCNSGSVGSEHRITLREYVDRYFSLYTKFLSVSTREGYYRSYTNKKPHGIEVYFGDTQMRRISSRNMQEYVNFLSTQVSPKSTKNYIQFLSVLFSHAVNDRIIPRDANPMLDIIKPKQRKREIETYDIDEAKQLLRYASNDGNKNIELIIYLAVLSGIRRGEMAALLWSDVDFKNNSIMITKSRLSVRGEDYVQPPKTDAGRRRIFIPPILVQVLKKYHTRYLENKLRFGKDFIDSGYVVTHLNGKPLTPQGISNCYLRFTKRIPLKYINFHSLRHCYSSLLIAQGENPKVVQKNLGHATLEMTLMSYSHAFESSQKMAAERLQETLALEEGIG